MRIAPKRAVISLVVFDLFALFYYVVGNVQEFLPETQFMLLSVLEFVSRALAAVGVVGLCMALLDIPPRIRTPAAVLGYGVAVIAAVAVFSAVQAIRVVSGGM